jgi:hypothetical protein
VTGKYPNLKMVLLDCGLVLEMGPAQHVNLVKVLGAFTKKDGRLAGQLMVDMSTESQAKPRDVELFVKGVEQLCIMDANQVCIVICPLLEKTPCWFGTHAVSFLIVPLVILFLAEFHRKSGRLHFGYLLLGMYTSCEAGGDLCQCGIGCRNHGGFGVCIAPKHAGPTYSTPAGL